jgi:hypothetical protein
MGRTTSRILTLVGRRAPDEDAPWEASPVQPLIQDDAPIGSGSAPVMLDADTGLDVLMRALLGTPAPTDAARDRQAADVEIRLAGVLADVGLPSVEPGRGSEGAPAASIDPVPQVTRFLELGESSQPTGPGRWLWLWLAVPLLLAVAFASIWLVNARGADRRPTTPEHAAQPTARE